MGLLQDYVITKNEMEDRMEGVTAHNYLLEYQELAYRVCVLQTLKVFTESVPDINDEKAVRYYGKATSAFLRQLPDEHTFAPKVNDDGIKKRETALKALRSACEDACAKLGDYKPSAQDLYSKEVSKMLKPVITIWAQYRDALVPIGGGAKEKKVEKTEKKPEKSETEEVQAAMQVICPLKKFKGMTLGEVLRQEARAIDYLATEFQGREEVRAAAKTLCEYAKKQSA